MSHPERLDALLRKILPRGALPENVRPIHVLDDAFAPPPRIAERVYALRELVRTGGREEPLTGTMASSRTVADYFGPRLRALRTEVIWVAGLDARHRVTATHCVGQGGATACAVEARDIFRPLVLNGCSALVLVHNHPSGETVPSAEDVTLTKNVRDAGRLLGIAMLDHVIIGASGYYSFLDSGLLG